MVDIMWRPGPEVERAHTYDFAFCGDPNCGLHFIPRRQDDTAICEIVMSAAQTLALLEACKAYLYEKAIKRDE